MSAQHSILKDALPLRSCFPSLARSAAGRGFRADPARSFAAYDDALIEAVVPLKYDEVTRLGDWFAARLARPLELVLSRSEHWKSVRGA